jgi:hypothetical protein
MVEILDRIERVPFARGTPVVRSPDGRSRGRYHLWGFSDDDWGNFEKACEVLQQGVDARRWPHVKITVFYTGTNRPDRKPHAIVLAERTRPRPFTEGDAEWRRFVRRGDSKLLEVAR